MRIIASKDTFFKQFVLLLLRKYAKRHIALLYTINNLTPHAQEATVYENARCGQ